MDKWTNFFNFCSFLSPLSCYLPPPSSLSFSPSLAHVPSLSVRPPLSLMKCVEESGVGPFLFNQNSERLFWLLSPLAPEVLAPVSCTQITYSENYCAWRTSLQVFFFFSFPPVPGRDSCSFLSSESILLLISTRNRPVARFESWHVFSGRLFWNHDHFQCTI